VYSGPLFEYVDTLDPTTIFKDKLFKSKEPTLLFNSIEPTKGSPKF
jgi:hypothetical protein